MLFCGLYRDAVILSERSESKDPRSSFVRNITNPGAPFNVRTMHVGWEAEERFDGKFPEEKSERSWRFHAN